jgi:hypothetical protein
VRLQLSTLSRKDEQRFWLLDQQWKKMGAKPREAFQVIEKFQAGPEVLPRGVTKMIDQLVERLLGPYTLQRQIRELFEGGMYLRGYQLLETFRAHGDISRCIYHKYFPSIFRAQVELKKWHLVKNELMRETVMWRAFEVYRTLNHEQQQELRSQLDDEHNLLAEILIDSEGTDVDDWTDDLINNWLTVSTTLVDPIIRSIEPGRRVKVIRNLLYFSHGDPRYHRDVGDIYTVPVEREKETTEDLLIRFRGSEVDFEKLFLQIVRDQADASLTTEERMGVEDVDLPERLYHEGTLMLKPEAELVFHQYPNLVKKYGRFIYFRDEAISLPDGFERIFDLIDHQDSLQVLRYYAEKVREKSRNINTYAYSNAWILETFGVRL